MSGAEPVMSCSSVLKARRISKAFKDRVVLSDVSLDVAPGEFVAIMGTSGSGKSTLLYALAALQRPDDGLVLWGETSVWELAEPELTRSRRRTCGFVFQFPAFLQDLTILENVALPLVLAGVSIKRARQPAMEMLDGMELGGFVSAFPNELSGGELQRASVARALVSNPSLVFADEPTGSLDDRNTEAVVGLLAAAASRTGVGVVVVTHDPLVARSADRTLSLRAGRLSGATLGPA